MFKTKITRFVEITMLSLRNELESLLRSIILEWSLTVHSLFLQMRALSPVPGWDREVAAHLPANRIREESPPHRQMSSGKQHFSDKMWQLSNLDRSRHLMEAVRCVTTDNKVCVCLVRAMSVAMLYTDVCRWVLLAPFVLWLYGWHFLCLSPQWWKKKQSMI